MKQKVSIICSVAFLISGFLVSLNNDALMSLHPAANAASPPVIQIPKDLLLGHTNNTNYHVFRDTVRDTIPLVRDTVKVTVTKWRTRYKVKEAVEADSIAPQAPVDTLYVSKPVLIIPTVKEEAVDTTSLAVQ